MSHRIHFRSYKLNKHWQHLHRFVVKLGSGILSNRLEALRVLTEQINSVYSLLVIVSISEITNWGIDIILPNVFSVTYLLSDKYKSLFHQRQLEESISSSIY